MVILHRAGPDVTRLSDTAVDDTCSTTLTLTWNSRRTIMQLLQLNPVTAKERLELHPRVDGVLAVMDKCMFSV